MRVAGNSSRFGEIASMAALDCEFGSKAELSGVASVSNKAGLPVYSNVVFWLLKLRLPKPHHLSQMSGTCACRLNRTVS